VPVRSVTGFARHLQDVGCTFGARVAGGDEQEIRQPVDIFERKRAGLFAPRIYRICFVAPVLETMMHYATGTISHERLADQGINSRGGRASSSMPLLCAAKFLLRRFYLPSRR
jgi:hypothetical protein